MCIRDSVGRHRQSGRRHGARADGRPRVPSRGRCARLPSWDRPDVAAGGTGRGCCAAGVRRYALVA
eukprot:5340034-Prymnesium_polylepis.1